MCYQYLGFIDIPQKDIKEKPRRRQKNEKENNFFFNLPFCKQNLFGLNTETFTER